MDKYKIHRDICDGLNKLYVEKNNDYGDSFGSARKEVPHYTLGKLYDKFSRFKSIDLGVEIKVKDETIEDTLLDMANYCIMEVTERRMATLDKTETPVQESKRIANNIIEGMTEGIKRDPSNGTKKQQPKENVDKLQEIADTVESRVEEAKLKLYNIKNGTPCDICRHRFSNSPICNTCKEGYTAWETDYKNGE